ncbi:uncharacterized protein L969DRAFT_91518 [Mixia osmundae IAM 14324]|uniref:Chitin-binding type-2 domain-containing protein n=1 Tax=Mixia osmundae (strain CBS 9802 / IAM 14324 / JCM 22182 / KY 12970) TaxID=764103 RepID=G7DVB4_MIXOS|nr:uncharacterized protein L969DRAFT_91518 [Mixia osmundae IAM 14324]KEI42053.1 hypothetical protein L969DRAFT_91518 [Mixia osmundae IAM 14324]GAA94524.1 hypothetical protein E5Q_01176 [Mixia osmundae IAM 14324]
MIPRITLLVSLAASTVSQIVLQSQDGLKNSYSIWCDVSNTPPAMFEVCQTYNHNQLSCPHGHLQDQSSGSVFWCPEPLGAVVLCAPTPVPACGL